MKSYRVVPPSMIDPVPGSVSTRPDTQLTISLPSMARVKDKLVVRINGALIYERGREHGGWRISREWQIDGRRLICFEQQRELEARDYLVQIEVVGFARSVNQRFLVVGAKTVCPAPHDEVVCRVPGGHFWINGSRWIFPDIELDAPAWYGRGLVVGPGCAVYRRAGMCAWREGDRIHTCAIPRRLLEPQMRLHMQAGDGWIMLAGMSMAGELYVMGHDSMAVWQRALVRDIGMTEGWLHLNMGDHSRHMPASYAPAIGDMDVEDLFALRVEDHMPSGSWSMRWGGDQHLWFNRTSLIAHVRPDLVMGESDAVLWTSDCIGEAIESVELLSGTTMFLNNKVIVNNEEPIRWEYV